VDGLVESFRSKRTEPGLLEVMSSSVKHHAGPHHAQPARDRPGRLVLRPDLADFQLMDFHRAREAIDIGRKLIEATQERLETVGAQLRARA